MNTTQAPAATTRIRVSYPRKGDYILTTEGWVRLVSTGVAGGQHEMLGEDGRDYRASQFDDIIVRRPNN